VSAVVAVRRQRIDSAAMVSTARGHDGGNALRTLEQRGGAKIRLPRPAGDALEAVLINTAGGLTGGDRIHWRCDAADATHLSVTTAASEKLYRAGDAEAMQTGTLSVGAHARLDWLPQETIVFDGARLRRRLEVDLAAGATFLAVESLLFGRRAMRERVTTGAVRDDWRIRREGVLLHAEALHIDAGRDLVPRSPAGFGGGEGADQGFGAQLTAVLCAPDPGELQRLHAGVMRALSGTESGVQDEPRNGTDGATREGAPNALPSASVRIGASVMPGRLVLRALARDGHALRQAVLPALRVLVGGDLPRVWYV